MHFPTMALQALAASVSRAPGSRGSHSRADCYAVFGAHGKNKGGRFALFQDISPPSQASLPVPVLIEAGDNATEALR